jgi:hypothetical protein
MPVMRVSAAVYSRVVDETAKANGAINMSEALAVLLEHQDKEIEMLRAAKPAPAPAPVVNWSRIIRASKKDGTAPIMIAIRQDLINQGFKLR